MCSHKPEVGSHHPCLNHVSIMCDACVKWYALPVKNIRDDTWLTHALKIAQRIKSRFLNSCNGATADAHLIDKLLKVNPQQALSLK